MYVLVWGTTPKQELTMNKYIHISYMCVYIYILNVCKKKCKIKSIILGSAFQLCTARKSCRRRRT